MAADAKALKTERRDQGAGKGCRRHGAVAEAETAAGAENEDAAEGRAPGDAQHVGVRQGIAQQCLEQHPGYRQGSAHNRGQQHPRQPHAQHDVRSSAGRRVAEQGGADIAQGEFAGPDAETKERARDEQRRQPEQDGYDPRRCQMFHGTPGASCCSPSDSAPPRSPSTIRCSERSR